MLRTISNQSDADEMHSGIDMAALEWHLPGPADCDKLRMFTH